MLTIEDARDPALTHAQRFLIAYELFKRDYIFRDFIDEEDVAQLPQTRIHTIPGQFGLWCFADGSTLVRFANHLEPAGWVLGYPRHRLPKEAE